MSGADKPLTTLEANVLVIALERSVAGEVFPALTETEKNAARKLRAISDLPLSRGIVAEALRGV